MIGQQRMEEYARFSRLDRSVLRYMAEYVSLMCAPGDLTIFSQWLANKKHVRSPRGFRSTRHISHLCLRSFGRVLYCTVRR